MKRIVCAVLCITLLVSAAAFAGDGALHIAPFGQDEHFSPYQGGILNLRVTNKAYGAYYAAAVTWEAADEAFEWVCGGLAAPLDETDAAQAIACFMSGEAFTMEGEGLADAEKASNKLPCPEGKPLCGDDAVRASGEWGDSSLCWAGSLSDMLQITGWGGRATSPDTDTAFATEDELFSYFTANFTNGGGYQSDGAVWFFSGIYERDVGMAALRSESGGGLLKDREIPVVRMTGAETGTAFAGQLCEILLRLSEGACIGLDVQMYETIYPLKADVNTFASFDYDRQEYRWSEFHFCEPDDALQELPFVMDEAGDIIPVTDAGNDLYTDEQGGCYPAAQVMTGIFVNYEGALYPTACEENNAEDRFFTIMHTAGEDELQMDAAESSYAGSHALTAIGYIRCTSGENPGLRALMIIDSDNSAHYWSPVGEDVLKQNRPDIYTMYYTETFTMDDCTTVALSDYIGRKAPVKSVALMTFAAD